MSYDSLRVEKGQSKISEIFASKGSTSQFRALKATYNVCIRPITNFIVK